MFICPSTLIFSFVHTENMKTITSLLYSNVPFVFRCVFRVDQEAVLLMTRPGRPLSRRSRVPLRRPPPAARAWRAPASSSRHPPWWATQADISTPPSKPVRAWRKVGLPLRMIIKVVLFAGYLGIVLKCYCPTVVIIFAYPFPTFQFFLLGHIYIMISINVPFL